MKEQWYECDYCKTKVNDREVSFVYPAINEPIDLFKRVKAICPSCLIDGKPEQEKNKDRKEFLDKIKQLREQIKTIKTEMDNKYHDNIILKKGKSNAQEKT